MKIVARRNLAGQIIMLARPAYTTIPSEGDIRPLKRRYQEFCQHSTLNGYWRDVTNEVAAVVRQTFAPPAPSDLQEPTP